MYQNYYTNTYISKEKFFDISIYSQYLLGNILKPDKYDFHSGAITGYQQNYTSNFYSWNLKSGTSASFMTINDIGECRFHLNMTAYANILHHDLLVELQDVFSQTIFQVSTHLMRQYTKFSEDKLSTDYRKRKAEIREFKYDNISISSMQAEFDEGYGYFPFTKDNFTIKVNPLMIKEYKDFISNRDIKISRYTHLIELDSKILKIFPQPLMRHSNLNCSEKSFNDSYFKIEIELANEICSPGEQLIENTLECVRCQPTFQRYERNDYKCIQCEKGLNCTDPINFTSADGYQINKITYWDEETSTDFVKNFKIYECPNKISCLSDNKCSLGYKSKMCLSCDSNIDENGNFYVKSGYNSCIYCRYSIFVKIVYFLGIIGITSLILVLVYMKHKNYKEKEVNEKYSINFVEHSIFIIRNIFYINFIINQIKNFHFNYNNVKESIFSSKSSGSSLSMMLSMNCMIHNIYSHEFLIKYPGLNNFFSFIFYVAILTLGIIILLVLRKKNMIITFIFYSLSLLTSYIFTDMSVPLMTFKFGDELYLKADGDILFNYFNLFWIVGFVIIFFIPIIYYKTSTHSNNTPMKTVICPKYLKFSHCCLKKLLDIFLTLGGCLINVIFSSTEFSGDAMLGLVYIFAILIIYSIFIYFNKPYEIEYFNKIEFICLCFCQSVILLAILHNKLVNYSRISEVTIIVLNLVIFLWTILTFLFLIILLIYFYCISKKIPPKSNLENMIAIKAEPIERKEFENIEDSRLSLNN